MEYKILEKAGIFTWNLIVALWKAGFFFVAAGVVVLFFVLRRGIRWLRKYIAWKTKIITQKIENEYMQKAGKLENDFTVEQIDNKVKLWMDMLSVSVKEKNEVISKRIQRNSDEIKTIKDVEIKEINGKLNANSERLARVEVKVTGIQDDIEEIKSGQSVITETIKDAKRGIINEIRERI